MNKKVTALSLIVGLLTVFLVGNLAAISPGEKPIAEKPTVQQKAAQEFFKKSGLNIAANDFSRNGFPDFFSKNEWELANKVSKKAGLSGASKFDANNFVFCRKRYSVPGYLEKYSICYFVQTSNKKPSQVILAGILVKSEFTSGLAEDVPNLDKTWIYAATTKISVVQKDVKQYYIKTAAKKPANMKDSDFFGGAAVPAKMNNDFLSLINRYQNISKTSKFFVVSQYSIPSDKCQQIFDTLKQTGKLPKNEGSRWIDDLGSNFYYTEKQYTAKKDSRKYFVSFCINNYYSNALGKEQDVAWLIVKPQIKGKNAQYLIYPINTKLSKIEKDIERLK